MCSGNKFPILTQRHCKVHSLVLVRILDIQFTTHLYHFTHILSFLFCLIIHITHVSFEALKSRFAVVLLNDATSHGKRKSQLLPSNSLRKELTNDIWFTYIVLTPVSCPWRTMSDCFDSTQMCYWFLICAHSCISLWKGSKFNRP